MQAFSGTKLWRSILKTVAKLLSKGENKTAMKIQDSICGYVEHLFYRAEDIQELNFKKMTKISAGELYKQMANTDGADEEWKKTFSKACGKALAKQPKL